MMVVPASIPFIVTSSPTPCKPLKVSTIFLNFFCTTFDHFIPSLIQELNHKNVNHISINDFDNDNLQAILYN